MKIIWLTVSILFACLILTAPSAKAKAPSDLSFYNPPSKLIAGKEGSVIWSRVSKEPSVHLSSSAKTTLILYRMRGVLGKTVPVSGTLDVPRGKKPKNGWPIISWGHGTVGMADVCAPSRGSGMTGDYILYTQNLYNKFLRAGFAVVRSDYEGLGTPGPHPYLIGPSEGRSMVEIVTAARQLDKSLGTSLIVAGHSQGGQSGLFAAPLVASLTPKIELKGVLVYAPASHFYQQKTLLPLLSSPSSLSALATMILTSAAREAKVNAAPLLSDPAQALLPQLEQVCSPQLAGADSFGGLAPSTLLREGADLGAVDGQLLAMNPSVKLKTPALIMQGASDSTVFPNFTQDLINEITLKSKVKPTYKIYPGLTHSTIVTDPVVQVEALAWIKKAAR